MTEAIKNLNAVMENREFMIDRILFSKRFRSDKEHDKAERALQNNSFKQLKTKFDKL